MAFSRDTLAEQLARELFSSFGKGRLLVGQAMPSEGELATSYGVSRAVVREALGHLKALGVVEVTSGKRAIVKVPDYGALTPFFTLVAAQQGGDMVQLREARCGIESECALLAAERRNEKDAEAISLLLGEMDAVVEADGSFDAVRYAELDRDFHLAIARASHNDVLTQLVLSMREPMKQSIVVGLVRLRSRADRRRMQAGHRDIAEAVIRGESDAASALVRRHVMADVLRSRPGRSGGPSREPNAHLGGLADQLATRVAAGPRRPNGGS